MTFLERQIGKSVLIVSLALLHSESIWAQEGHHHEENRHDVHQKHQHQAQVGEVKDGVQSMKVLGMVCEVCVAGIKKALLKESVVSQVELNTKDHILKITYKNPKETLSKERISQILEEAGGYKIAE